MSLKEWRLKAGKTANKVAVVPVYAKSDKFMNSFFKVDLRKVRANGILIKVRKLFINYLNFKAFLEGDSLNFFQNKSHWEKIL